MILFRVLQGVFGAALVPLSQAVLLDINPPDRHGQAMAVWGVGVMLGPILGPTLGGYLTEYFNWRWVFFINVPVGIASLAGFILFMPETDKAAPRRFDWFGFILLSVFVGALQMMLDRGETLDWFSSMEIVIELAVAVLGFYLFIVHTLTADKPFLAPAMFADRNYVVSLVFMFVFGIIILASMALLPPFLQNLKGYPVILSGLVMAPRGMGTMAAMLVVGRLVGKVDARILIFFGFALIAYSLHDMSLFTLDVPAKYIIYTGVVQGFGMGFVFVPLSTIAYRTLAPHFRNDAAAVFSLSRNIGSSLGISIVMAMLAQFTQINHADITALMLPFGNAGRLLSEFTQMSTGTGADQAVAMLNAAVTQQAAVIGYLNDFRLLMYLVIVSAPLLLFVRMTPTSKVPPKSEAEEFEGGAAMMME
jgi:DHA2 family multidrug resistance protein